MLHRIADRIILCPSRNEIRVDHKTRMTLGHAHGEVEIWRQRRGGLNGGSNGNSSRGEPDIFVLKFGGTGSRAERATIFPLDFWEDMAAEIWAPNWPGFGGSAGRTSMRPLAEIGLLCYDEIRRAADGRPIVVTGNSLGTAVALAVAAAHRDMAGLILRNPPPLRQLICRKHGWYSGWLAAWLVSRGVPQDLDSIANARGSDVPALFVTSGKDRVVPPEYQQLVIDAYAGPKRMMLLPTADHDNFPAEDDLPAYRDQLEWLRLRAGLAGERVAAGTPARA